MDGFGLLVMSCGKSIIVCDPVGVVCTCMCVRIGVCVDCARTCELQACVDCVRKYAARTLVHNCISVST